MAESHRYRRSQNSPIAVSISINRPWVYQASSGPLFFVEAGTFTGCSEVQRTSQESA